MTVTVPTLLPVLLLVALAVASWWALAWYINRRWFDPWLKRKCVVEGETEATDE